MLAESFNTGFSTQRSDFFTSPQQRLCFESFSFVGWLFGVSICLKVFWFVSLICWMVGPFLCWLVGWWVRQQENTKTL